MSVRLTPPNILPDRACTHCGKLYTPKNSGQKYCSAQCRTDAGRDRVREYSRAYHRAHYVKRKREVAVKVPMKPPCGLYESCFECGESDCRWEA